jgi:hypothetical protein
MTRRDLKLARTDQRTAEPGSFLRVSDNHVSTVHLSRSHDRSPLLLAVHGFVIDRRGWSGYAENAISASQSAFRLQYCPFLLRQT